MNKVLVYVPVTENGKYYYVDEYMHYLETTENIHYADHFYSKDRIESWVGHEFDNGEKFEPTSIHTVEIEYNIIESEEL